MTEKDLEIQQLRAEVRRLEEQHRKDKAEIRKIKRICRGLMRVFAESPGKDHAAD